MTRSKPREKHASLEALPLISTRAGFFQKLRSPRSMSQKKYVEREGTRPRMPTSILPSPLTGGLFAEGTSSGGVSRCPVRYLTSICKSDASLKLRVTRFGTSATAVQPQGVIGEVVPELVKES